MTHENGHEIQFAPVRRTGRYALWVLDQDGSKVLPPLLFDDAPKTLDSHLIVAAGAIWGSRVTSRFAYRGELNERIVDAWADQGAVRIVPTTVTPEEPAKDRFTALNVTLSPSLTGETPGRDTTVLGLVPGERFHGSLTGVKERIVGSNAWMFEADMVSLAQLAAGVLYADELLARSIGIDAPLPPATSEFAEALLAPLGLTLHQEEQ